MVYRERVEWPAHVRELLGEELIRSHEEALAAKEAFKIRVYIAVEQGVTTREIADHLGISQATISRYRIEGETAYRERQAAAE